MIKTITNRLFLLVTMLLLSTVNALAQDVSVAQIGNEKYETLQAAIAAVQANGEETTITMLANESIEGNAGLTIAAGKNIVLDLNGRTIQNLVNENKASQVFTNRGTLTIKDTAGNGVLKNNVQEGTKAGEWWGTPQYNYVTNVITNLGTLNIYSGTIEQTAAGSICYAVDNNSNAVVATLNLYGGKLINSHKVAVRMFCNSVNHMNTFNIPENSTVEIVGYRRALWVQLPGSQGQAKMATVTIAGGTMKGTGINDADNGYAFYDSTDGDVYTNVTYNITGGNFEGNLGTDNTGYKFISGGTFNVDPTEFVAEGYEAVDLGDDTWIVQEAIGPVMIKGSEEEEGAYYATLEEAFAAVKDKQTISLNDHITLSEALNLELAGKTVTLDLDAYTLTGRVNLKSGTLTVTGGTNGTVTNPGGQALNVYGSATAVAEPYSVLNVDCRVQDADFDVCMFGPTASSEAGYGAVVNISKNAILNCTGEAAIFVSGNLGKNIAGNMNNVINIEGQVLGLAPSDDSPNNTAGVALHGNATVNVLADATVSGNTGIAIKRGVLNVIGGTVWGEGDENLNPDANNNGVELTGAAISMTDTYNNYGSMVVNISGGDIISDKSVALFKKEGNYTNAATFAVSGGTFSSPVLAEFCAEGYVPTALGNNQYGVKQAVPVAKIGETEYTTLAAAIAAANVTGNVTINLLRDYDFEANEPGYGYTSSFLAEGESTTRNNMLVFSANNITFDLGGHTISNLFNNTFNVTGSNVTFQNGGMSVGQLYYSSADGKTIYTSENQKTCSYIVYVTNATDFTVNDLTTYGGINVSASTATINDLSFSGTKFYAVCSQDNSTVTLNGGTYTKAITGAAGYMFWVQAGSVMNIVGGTYTKGSLANFRNGINPVITGGTFDFDPTNYGVAAGYEAVNNNNGTWTVSPVAVAKIGETEYTTLAAAFEAAQNGQTIKLIADCELTEVLTNTKNVTLDLGTFTISGTIEDFMIQNKGTLVINADATNPGKIYNTILANKRGPVRNLAEGTITINGGIFGDNDADPTNVGTVNGGYGFHNLGTATINGGIFTTGDPEYDTAPTRWAYAVTNGDGETTTAQLTINGGKVYGKHGDIANNSGTMIINDVTTFGTAQYYSIYNALGDVTVNGGTFVKQVGRNNLHVYVSDATASVTVKGGTFTKNTIDKKEFAAGNGTVALMGGTYNKQPEAKFVAAGYEAVDNGDGTWTVNAKDFTITTFKDENLNSVFVDKVAGEPVSPTVTVNAKTGQTVTLIIAPTADYSLKSLSLNGGAQLSAVEGDKNQRTFVMPAADVTISAEFVLNEAPQTVEEATISDEGEATITNVEIAQDGVKNVTVSAAIGSAEVTEIAEGAFASLPNTVQTIDLSSTQVALEGERSENKVLKDIPATALVYLPSSSSNVTGTNVVIKDENSDNYTCVDFQMDDMNDYSIPTPFTATTATLNRPFSSGTHCTICLPYDVPASDIPGSIYRYTGFDSATPAIEMTIDEDGLDANVPYIFVPDGNSQSISTSSTSGTIQVSMSVAPQKSIDGFTFKGVFEEKHFTPEEYQAGIYGYAGVDTQTTNIGYFYKLGLQAWVPAMRAYLVSNSVAGAPSINGAQAAPALPSKIKVILKSATGETTDILHFDMETTEDDAPVYNLSGQRVNNATKGIYIKNGKKVVIK